MEEILNPDKVQLILSIIGCAALLCAAGQKIAPFTETKKDDIIFAKALKLLGKITVFATTNKLMQITAANLEKKPEVEPRNKKKKIRKANKKNES